MGYAATQLHFCAVRMLQVKQRVTLVVRAHRVTELVNSGLVIKSSRGGMQPSKSTAIASFCVALTSRDVDSVLNNYLNNLSALFSVCSTPHMSGRPTSAQASISFIV